MKKKLLIPLGIVLCFAVILTTVFYLYCSDIYQAQPAAALALEETSSIGISVIDDGTTMFTPPGNPEYGFIFYPDAKTDSVSYAPLMVKLASRGVKCFCVEMPLHMPNFGRNKADGIISSYSKIKHWYIGGHGFGGEMAADFAGSHSDKLDGLVLMAAYSAKDISGSGLKVLSVYGNADRVLDMQQYEAFHSNLPGNANECIIQGGCYSYFGNYGKHDGDGVPNISRDEQMDEVCRLISESMKETPTT